MTNHLQLFMKTPKRKIHLTQKILPHIYYHSHATQKLISPNSKKHPLPGRKSFAIIINHFPHGNLVPWRHKSKEVKMPRVSPGRDNALEVRPGTYSSLVLLRVVQENYISSFLRSIVEVAPRTLSQSLKNNAAIPFTPAESHDT